MMEKPPEKPLEKVQVEVLSSTPVTPEEMRKKWEDEQFEAFKKDHPEALKEPEPTVEGDPRIAEFNTLCDAFEAKHDLAALNAIIDLTPAESPNHPIREPARKDLPPIVALRKALNDNDEVKARYKRISQAVGVINSGKVDHTR